jgi:hypothetical protein
MALRLGRLLCSKEDALAQGRQRGLYGEIGEEAAGTKQDDERRSRADGDRAGGAAGIVLGRVQAKADGWLENEALRQQVTQIRDGATQLLNRVNSAAATARKLAPPKRHGREGESVAKPAPVKKAKATKGRNGGVVDAPARRLRKPPPQELFDPRLGEPMGKQMGQKNLKRRGRG